MKKVYLAMVLFQQLRFDLAEQELRNALLTIKPSTKEWFATIRNCTLRSNQGRTDDEILKHLKM